MMMAVAEAERIVAEALEGLVHQFSDPLACFRELVQNAVDAGSTEIDIRFAHEGGRLVVDVDDYGEGMDRRIIDTKLTRLFSSSKDDDRTKIGRFGIGFVSVFALDPEVIRIDTSRSGEHWRVIFRPDRTFTRVAREQPVDGTKIRIYKSASADGAREFAARARRAIEFWCRHVPAEIRVDGRPIGAPFEVQAPCAVAGEFGEARIAAGYAPDGLGAVGYYNRGLTLLEEPGEEFPGVIVKLWSPELEHTMTRDNVLRDAGYERVIGHARALVRGPLRERLLDVLHAQAPALHRPGEATEHLYTALARHVAADDDLPRTAKKRPIVRLVDGSLTDLTAVARAGKKHALWHAPGRSPVTELLTARGDVVLAAAGDAAVLQLVRAVGGTAVPVGATWCTAILTPEGQRPAGFGALRAALHDLAGPTIRGVELGSLEYPGSPVATRAAIAQAEPGGLTRLKQAGTLEGRPWLVLHAGHPAVAAALALAPREPELAAVKMIKLFCLEGQVLSVSHAAALTTAALERRCRRTT
jgi:hypothetical protein